MKAIRVHSFGAPEVMQLEEVADPVPKKDQVLVRVKAAGVNPVDTYIRSGRYAAKPELPFTPGSDAGGTIEKIGAGVTGFEVGDRVYVFRSVSGTYAELALCDASQVYPLPENISFSQGAAIGTAYGAAYRALIQRGAARPGETVLVHGATGGVGIAAIQIAKSMGLFVIGTSGSPEGDELVRSQGADRTARHGDVESIRSLAPTSDGITIILEMLANANLANDLAILAPHGRVVIIGSRGSIEIEPRMTMARELDIRGMMLGLATDEENIEMQAALGAGLRSGTLRPVVSHEFPLQDAARAHHMIMESSAMGKIVLLP